MGFLTLGGAANAVAAGVRLTERALRGERTAVAELIYWHAANDDVDSADSWNRVLRTEPRAMAELGRELAGSADPDRRAYAPLWFARAAQAGSQAELGRAAPGREPWE